MTWRSGWARWRHGAAVWPAPLFVCCRCGGDSFILRITRRAGADYLQRAGAEFIVAQPTKALLEC